MTRGFQMSAMPEFRGVDPRLFDFGGSLADGLSSGVRTGGQLQDIIANRDKLAYEQSLRPYRQQLMDVQLDSARTGLAGVKAEQHLADIALPAKERAAADPTVMQSGTFLETDPKTGQVDEYKWEHKRDPKTGELSYAPRIHVKTVKTSAEAAKDDALAKANLALVDYRGKMGAAAAQRAVTADEIATFKRDNPTVRTKQVYDSEENVYEQVIMPDGSLGEPVQVMVKTGVPAKRPRQQTTFELLMPKGAATPSPSAPPKAPASNALDQLTSELSAPMKTSSVAAPSAQAIVMLKQNPSLSSYFDQKYGPGEAAQFLA
jgi:hypothetical protein